ncbi:MAG TPA: arginyltransferase [Candidatus Competibacteraceae bacterium]|nr:arginyltransferase [Candidatus Competibacteraceae bacterium]
MSRFPSDRLARLRVFVTIEHPCGYLPGRIARNLLADPEEVDQDLYQQLAKLGFRRSGGYIYRPFCPECQACRSLRIPSDRFCPNRAQRRTWQRNQDLQVFECEPHFNPEHYLLYERYLRYRHPGGGMDDTSPQQYLSFVRSIWSHTRFYEFRQGERLLAVAVVDHLDDGLSAVYTFYTPDEAARSLGTYAILWQLQEARRLGLPWVYLGYWVEGCRKMDYKTRFQPHQLYQDGNWRWHTPS